MSAKMPSESASHSRFWPKTPRRGFFRAALPCGENARMKYRVRFVFDGRQVTKTIEADTAVQARRMIQQQFGLRFNEILSVIPIPIP